MSQLKCAHAQLECPRAQPKCAHAQVKCAHAQLKSQEMLNKAKQSANNGNMYVLNIYSKNRKDSNTKIENPDLIIAESKQYYFIATYNSSRCSKEGPHF